MKDNKPAVMKQFFYFLAALLFGAALFSCANEAAVSGEDYHSKSIKLVFDVSPFGAVDENDIDTKTHVTPINNYAGYKFYWSANDTVGIFPSGGSQIYFRVDSDGEASGADFDGGAWEPRAGYTFHGYFPFIGNYYLDATKIPVSFLGQKQEGNANSNHFQNYDFMCTPTTSYDEELQDFRFSFKHMITGVLPWVEVPAGHYVGLDLSLDDPLFVTEGEYDLTAENPTIIGKKFTKDFHIDLDITFEQTETLIAYVPLAPLNIAGKTLTITITDESGTNYSYTYSPSRAYVASNIYRLRSSVSFAIGSVSVDPTEINLYVDQTQQLTATVLPENYTNKSVTWSSSAPAVATVNESGEVTAVSVGSATITVTTVEGGLTATSTVIVRPAPINFADPAVKEICVENWDTDGDGELSYEEAAAVTTISFLFSNNETITSFDEFQYFTGVSSINQAAFSYCSNLTSISLPEGVNNIGERAFARCSSLTNITIPLGVTSIDRGAFEYCIAITDIIIPSGVTSIGQSAFYNCSSLSNINIPVGITSISENTFGYCTSLTSVTIPVGVTEIEKCAFFYCDKMASITIPAGVTVIGESAFYWNSSLRSITIPAGVVEINAKAFYGCKNLTNIIIPDSVTTIGEYAFAYCRNLSSIQVNALIPPTGSSDMFSETGNGPIYVPGASVNAYKTAEYWKDYAYRIQAIPGSVIEVSGVSLNNSTLSLTVGSSETLTATVSPDNATNKTVSWSTSDSGVASVSDGLVTAVGVGNATITVTTEDGGKTATCAVTVNPVEVTSVTLDQNTLSLTKGGTATLVATVNPATATNKTVTWSSNDANVATVDVNGKVTAVGGGSATITATAGGKSATCDVTVSVPVTGVQLNNTSANIIVGETVRLKATVVPDDATNKNVNWTSSKPEVADISAKGAEAKVTGRGVGTSIITVSTEDGNITEECTVIVSAVEVTSVSLDKTTLSLERGASESLSATVLPENATYSTVTWNSSAPDVVYVDNYGLVTALRGGTSLITATAGGHTATCEVTVPSYWGVVGSFNEWTEDIIATENNGVWSALVNLTSSSEFKWRKNSGWDEDYGGTESTWGNPVGEPFPAALHGCNIAISEGYWRLSLDLSGNTPLMMVSTGDGSVLSVSLNKQSTVLTVGQSETLIPKVLPVDATNKNLSWTSSNTSVATVANGVVTAVSAGTATITVTTVDGSKTATCSVTVNPVSGGNEGVIGGVVD